MAALTRRTLRYAPCPRACSGKLLIASPSMSDAFRRAVVLVVEHGDEGAFGLVLNQPSESTVARSSPSLPS